MTWRRLALLVQQLPQSSRIKTLLSGDDENQRWSAIEHLLALQADQLSALLSIKVAENSKGKKPEKITPVTRPNTKGGPGATEHNETLAQARALLDRMGRGEAEGEITPVLLDGGPTR